MNFIIEDHTIERIHADFETRSPDSLHIRSPGLP